MTYYSSYEENSEYRIQVLGVCYKIKVVLEYYSTSIVEILDRANDTQYVSPIARTTRLFVTFGE